MARAAHDTQPGIRWRVDAGKTTLTDRLLYAAGVIDSLGSVDAGTTQTDSLALERQRGITIKSAVASFGIGEPCPASSASGPWQNRIRPIRAAVTRSLGYG